MLILDQFALLSGMNINYSKSAIFFGGLVKHRQWITSHLGLTMGDLPIRYLGIPLISKRLSVGACSPLIQAVTRRLQSWKAKLLSFTGRAELIKAVLSAMHLFWTSVLTLPTGVLKEIDKLLLSFLWYGLGPRRSVFISWKHVCRPKEEGGLGIRRPINCNVEGILRLLWEFEMNKEALWVKWMRLKYTRRGSVWCTRPLQQASWAWRGILRVRHLAVNLLNFNLGDGRHTLFPRSLAQSPASIIAHGRSP